MFGASKFGLLITYLQASKVKKQVSGKRWLSGNITSQIFEENFHFTRILAFDHRL
jgi:hypothetical protein